MDKQNKDKLNAIADRLSIIREELLDILDSEIKDDEAASYLDDVVEIIEEAVDGISNAVKL